ncbi:hypothetical protein PoB_007706000 [Plakobranchus ocellatus]|uniref:SAC domain-containing protein n=1 Tax=Plakobranchus ocellatus TaxID=259542 RepID=A0AAV4E2V5_9GAST|nr:hypothetical protein PoB_007706000 [Plakobranchus ocellatus]
MYSQVRCLKIFIYFNRLRDVNDERILSQSYLLRSVYVQDCLKAHAWDTYGQEVYGFLYITSPQQGDLGLPGPPSSQGAGGGARTRDRMVPADLRADLPTTVPPTPPKSLRTYA